MQDAWILTWLAFNADFKLIDLHKKQGVINKIEAKLLKATEK